MTKAPLAPPVARIWAARSLRSSAAETPPSRARFEPGCACAAGAARSGPAKGPAPLAAAGAAWEGARASAPAATDSAIAATMSPTRRTARPAIAESVAAGAMSRAQRLDIIVSPMGKVVELDAPGAESRASRRGRQRRRPSKTALVLGGGGFTGGVYEIGALRALDLLAVNRTINDFDI